MEFPGREVVSLIIRVNLRVFEICNTIHVLCPVIGKQVFSLYYQGPLSRVLCNYHTDMFTPRDVFFTCEGRFNGRKCTAVV